MTAVREDIDADVYVVPDLTLLICPPSATGYDKQFFEIHWPHFLRHDQKIRTYALRWALSPSLISHMMGEVPWRLVRQVPDVRTMMPVLEELYRQAINEAIKQDRNMVIDPDICPAYVSGETTQLWKDLLSWCIQRPYTLTKVASHPGQPEELKIRLNSESIAIEVQIVRDISEWDTTYASTDLWDQYSLPRSGETYYKAPPYWQPGQPLPKRKVRDRVGFIDQEGRLWLWDRAEGHWDVQDRRPGLGKYIRVTTDGQLLD